MGMERKEFWSPGATGERERDVESRLSPTSELQQYTAALRERGLRLKDLATHRRPRSAGLRHRLQIVGRGLATDPDLAETVRSAKPLPLRPLARRFQISPHTIRKWENFLVAIALAYLYDLPSIQRYLDDIFETPLSARTVSR